MSKLEDDWHHAKYTGSYDDMRIAGNALLDALQSFPPDGWFYFGSHAPYPWLSVEFSSEVDDTGMPLWERPKTL